jgi:hypothetical protein
MSAILYTSWPLLMDKYELHGADRAENAAAFMSQHRMKRHGKLPGGKRKSWEG